jgi:hypothetical protein
MTVMTFLRRWLYKVTLGYAKDNEKPAILGGAMGDIDLTPLVSKLCPNCRRVRVLLLPSGCIAAPASNIAGAMARLLLTSRAFFDYRREAAA